MSSIGRFIMLIVCVAKISRKVMNAAKMSPRVRTLSLPGEPLQEMSTAIQHQSRFPHTVVLGYSNGRGVGYVGLPGGKAKGGYEMGEVGTGSDEAGKILVDTAVRLLHEHFAAKAGKS